MTDLNHHVAAQTIHEYVHFNMKIPVPGYLSRVEHSKSFYGQKYPYFFDILMCSEVLIGEKVVY